MPFCLLDYSLRVIAWRQHITIDAKIALRPNPHHDGYGYVNVQQDAAMDRRRSESDRRANVHAPTPHYAAPTYVRLSSKFRGQPSVQFAGTRLRGNMSPTTIAACQPYKPSPYDVVPAVAIRKVKRAITLIPADREDGPPSNTVLPKPVVSIGKAF